MIRYLRWLEYLLKHKWYVLYAGRLLGVSHITLINHDMSKFSYAEFKAYAQAHFDEQGNARWENSASFQKAWEHHKSENPHHWQYWVSKTGEPLYIPVDLMKEMVADIAATGKAITGEWEFNDWYYQHKDKFNIHHLCTRLIELYMDELTTKLEQEGEYVKPKYRPPTKPASTNGKDDVGTGSD